MANDQIVHEFRKSPDEIVRATIGEFRGRKTVGVRIYYEDVSGEWKPTKKGITLTADLFSELKKAIGLLEEGLGEEAGEGEKATEAEPAASPEAEPAE